MASRCNLHGGDPLGCVRCSTELLCLPLCPPPGWEQHLVPSPDQNSCLSPGGRIPVCQQRRKRPLHRPGWVGSRLGHCRDSLRVERECGTAARWPSPCRTGQHQHPRVAARGYRSGSSTGSCCISQKSPPAAGGSRPLRDNPVPVSHQPTRLQP